MVEYAMGHVSICSTVLPSYWQEQYRVRSSMPWSKHCQVLQSIAKYCKKSAGLRCPGADIAKRTSYLAIWARPHTRRSSQPPSHTPSPPPNIIIIQILLCGSFPQRCENLIARKLQKLEIPRALEPGIVIATDQ